MNDQTFLWQETHNRERLVGIGRGDLRKIKRLSAKRNRKRAVPRQSMRGYGRGDENYRWMYAD